MKLTPTQIVVLDNSITIVSRRVTCCCSIMDFLADCFFACRWRVDNHEFEIVLVVVIDHVRIDFFLCWKRSLRSRDCFGGDTLKKF